MAMPGDGLPLETAGKYSGLPADELKKSMENRRPQWRDPTCGFFGAHRREIRCKRQKKTSGKTAFRCKRRVFVWDRNWTKGDASPARKNFFAILNYFKSVTDL
jgi:hypothetical protein